MIHYPGHARNIIHSLRNDRLQSSVMREKLGKFYNMGKYKHFLHSHLSCHCQSPTVGCKKKNPLDTRRHRGGTCPASMVLKPPNRFKSARRASEVQ